MVHTLYEHGRNEAGLTSYCTDPPYLFPCQPAVDVIYKDGDRNETGRGYDPARSKWVAFSEGLRGSRMNVDNYVYYALYHWFAKRWPKYKDNKNPKRSWPKNPPKAGEFPDDGSTIADGFALTDEDTQDIPDAEWYGGGSCSQASDCVDSEACPGGMTASCKVWGDHGDVCWCS